ncbi:MAG: SRPBCC family protein [Candidatus Omnitrophica bacterium]|nr:SRPBCC family protein [Candidatus Omnitrophota bacterium]
MLDSPLVETRLVKVIPAPVWKVLRLITQPDKFPQYVPCVREVSVVQKQRHVVRTRWRLEVEKIPISWIEEDILMLKQGIIYFKAIEGDLAEFRGEWKIQPHPEGTEVTVSVCLKTGIPAIEAFAEAHIKKLLTRNFEAILEGIERRLISIRYASYKKGDIKKIAGFGLIGHPYNFNHLVRFFSELKPDFKVPSREFLGKLFSATPSFKLCDIRDFKSQSGESTNGCLIVATLIPDMLEKDPWALFSKVVRACQMAEKNGVGIVALGGFSSIISQRIGHDVAEDVDVAVTTGNTFTAAMVIDGVRRAAELLNLDLATAKLTLIGSRGDVGKVCARVFVDKVREITITDRRPIDTRLLAELKKRRKARITAIPNNRAAVATADIVIAAANVSASFINIDWFKPGAIVCDVGYPKNISYTATYRKDILIFSGGLAKIPTPLSLPADIGLPVNTTLYGCFCEAIILALEKRYENFSPTNGQILPEKIEEIRELGRRHGFGVADFYWGNKLIDAQAIEEIKRAQNG